MENEKIWEIEGNIWDIKDRLDRIEYFLRDQIEEAMEELKSAFLDHLDLMKVCSKGELISWVLDLKDIRWTQKDVYRAHKELKDKGEIR